MGSLQHGIDGDDGSHFSAQLDLGDVGLGDGGSGVKVSPLLTLEGMARSTIMVGVCARAAGAKMTLGEDSTGMEH
jgi:hypothetical protein